MASDPVHLGRLSRADLMSLEQYSSARKEFRGRVLDHKRNRLIAIGPNVTWAFEDRFTVQYQVQEMLRVERIFEAAGIQDELDAYNPLIPDGSNWKVTFLIEFPDAEERKQRLAAMKGIEDRCWVQVAGLPRSFAIADEDLERENEEKTSSVHFLRFELSAEMAAKVKSGAAVQVGIDHPSYRHEVQLSQPQRDSLAKDLS
ncbi:DUF3501 family protein [Steroidobacter cummioxidans]|uniref:DUF3501 family protein n=1 Tax=Steroidobacter cummioxidans TaxID=1803913 RepID=UPI000E322580|nr:DUF3501 family protein [Steroidobacter cummioxidans]